jgi:hypothetical protein
LPSLYDSILLSDYLNQVETTDRLPTDDLQPVLLGLFGEVGGIMAAAKKLHREKEAYTGYRHAVEDDFGDALWYLTALCRRLNMRVDEIFAEVIAGNDYSTLVAENDLPKSHLQCINTLSIPGLDSTLLQLGETAGDLLVLRSSRADARSKIAHFADSYLRALSAAQVSFVEVVRKNTMKTTGRFLDPDYATLPTFDSDFPEEEQLPKHFEITINQHSSGRSYLRWNGVFIGDPLTDNIRDPDGYRYHDVFHLTHAAILHWSPTFRSLIKQKRKSVPKTDEAQDGGRAIVIEEGLTAWIFSRAKELNYFEGQTTVSFDLLKTIQQFVAGYEVEACPLRLWEIAILKGYEVFRQVRTNNGGIIMAYRATRTVGYKPLTEMKT